MTEAEVSITEKRVLVYSTTPTPYGATSSAIQTLPFDINNEKNAFK